MTNGDRIRAMSDEQMADFLNSVTEDEGLVGYCQNKKICEDKLDRDDVIPVLQRKRQIYFAGIAAE